MRLAALAKLFRYRIIINEDATCKMSIHPVALAAAATAAMLITEQCRPAGGSTPILPPHAASPLSDHRHSLEPGWTEGDRAERNSGSPNPANLLSIEVHRLRALLRSKRGEAVWGKRATPSAKWRTPPFLTSSQEAQAPPAPEAPQPCASNPRLARCTQPALEVR